MLPSCCLRGAPLLLLLLLLLPSGFFALTLRDIGTGDPWVDECQARAQEHEVDELDYGPCFDATPASQSAMLVGEEEHLDNVTSMFTEADDWCDNFARPMSDSDKYLGHGNPVCRYEPSKQDLEKFRRSPEDIAILVPSNLEGDREDKMSEDPNDMYPLNQGVLTWRKYARYHGYAFYSGLPRDAEAVCPGLSERHPAWSKPCMAMQLIKRHKLLLIVDRDTTVLKPRLRLEPLYALAGLLDPSSGKVFAVAEEWGSCKKGVRCPLSGDVNTGIMLIRQSTIAARALEAWYHGPTRCQGAPIEHIEPFKGWPFHSPPCTGCGCVLKSVKWSYDQVAFYGSVASNKSYKDHVSVFRAGCPINSPFADFILHLVSGTPDQDTYNIKDRNPLAKGLYACNSKLLEGESGDGDLYARCSVCGALPKERVHHKHGPWSISCGSALESA